MMSIFYMILMTAYSSFQLVITKVYEQANEKALGPFSFMVNYCFDALSFCQCRTTYNLFCYNKNTLYRHP